MQCHYGLLAHNLKVNVETAGVKIKGRTDEKSSIESNVLMAFQADDLVF